MSENKIKAPTMEELFKKYPPKKSEDTGGFEFGDEDEEEAFDMVSSLLPMERKFYDESGEWIGDDEEAVDAREEQLKAEDKKYNR